MIINKEENVLKVTPTILSEYINKRISSEVEKQIKKRLDTLSVFGLYEQEAEKEEDKQQFDVDRIIEQISSEGHGVAYIQGYFYKNYAIKLPESRIIPFHKGIIKEYQSWKRKPLTSVYPILWIESLDYQLNQGGVVVHKKLFYCFGVDSSGFKKVIAAADGENEAMVLRNLFFDMSNRGVKDILILCMKDINRYHKIINEYFGNALLQENITFEINEVLGGIPLKYVPEFRKGLTAIYKAPTQEKALEALEDLALRWESEFPVQCARCKRFVSNLATYWQLPESLKKLVYLTKLDQRIYKKMKLLIEALEEDLVGEQLLVIFYRCQQDISSSRDRYRIYRWRSMLVMLQKNFPDRI